MAMRGIIFDLDGTLLDSLRGIAETMNRLLEKLGFAPIPEDRYRMLVGDGIANLVIGALPHGFAGTKDIAALVVEYRRIYDEIWRDHTAPYPGVPAMLDSLSGKDLKLAVLSNKSQVFTTQMVEEILGRWRFDRVLGESPDFPLKPDPLAALDIADTFGLPAEEIALVGDSGIDMKTAGGAGMCPIGVGWGFRTKDELHDAGARHLLKEPGDLPVILEAE